MADPAPITAMTPSSASSELFALNAPIAELLRSHLSTLAESSVTTASKEVTSAEIAHAKPTNNSSFVTSELADLELSGAVAHCEASDIAVSSPLSVTTSASGKKRLILDLSRLNKFLITSKFRLDDWRSIWNVLPEHKFGVTFDFRSGYHHVSIAQQHQKYLGFRWQGHFYKFRVLPFGLSSAPFVFHKLFRPLITKWRAAGISVSLYLDDGVVLGRTYEECQAAASIVRSDLVTAGITFAIEKCKWCPEKSITWLGYVADFNAETLSLSDRRIQTASRRLQSLRDSKYPTVGQREVVLGTLNSMFMVAAHEVSIMSAETRGVVARARSSGKGSKHREAMLSAEREEIDWFSANLGGPTIDQSDAMLSRPSAALPELNFFVGPKARKMENIAEEWVNRGLHQLVPRLQEIVNGSLAPRTLRAYAAAEYCRRAWTGSHGFHPDDPSGALAFLVHRSLKVQKSSLNTSVAAFSWASDVHVDRSLLSAIRSTSARSARRREKVALDSTDIQKINAWATGALGRRECRAAVAAIFAFLGLMRANELAGLKWADLIETEDYIKVIVRRAKNDQCGKGAATYIKLGDLSEIWLRYKAFFTGTSAFVFASFQNGSALSPTAIAKELRWCFQQAGAKENATSHSLRRGGAQLAIEDGCSLDQVQARGRWRSPATVALYIKNSPRGQGGFSQLPY